MYSTNIMYSMFRYYTKLLSQKCFVYNVTSVRDDISKHTDGNWAKNAFQFTDKNEEIPLKSHAHPFVLSC